MGGLILIERFKELTPGYSEVIFRGYHAIVSVSRTHALVNSTGVLSDMKNALRKSIEIDLTKPDILSLNAYKLCKKLYLDEDTEYKYIKVNAKKVGPKDVCNYKKVWWGYAGHVLNDISEIFKSGYTMYFPSVPIFGYAQSGEWVIIFSPCYAPNEGWEDMKILEESTQVSFEDLEDDIW